MKLYYPRNCKWWLTTIQAAKKFKDAPIIVGEKVLKDTLNNKIVEGFATKSKQDLHNYHVNDWFKGKQLSMTLMNHLLKVPSNMIKDTIIPLPLVPGMKLMITDNIAMWAHVANRCQGVLQDVKHEISKYEDRRAVCTYVQVPGANIQAPGLLPDVIPILPETVTFKYKIAGDTPYSIKCTQLPLLPTYTFILNTIQGQSLQYALVDLKSAQVTQALYMMISKAISLNNLVVMWWFLSNNLDHTLSPAYQNEWKRVQSKKTEECCEQTAQKVKRRNVVTW